MAQVTRPASKAKFETGDVPTGADFADLHDSVAWGTELAAETAARQAADALLQPKETGKGLSTNDYTTTEKNKLAGIASGATANRSDSATDSLINAEATTRASADTAMGVLITALQNKVVTAIAFTGTTTKTLTLTFADNSTLTATFTDNTATGGGGSVAFENITGDAEDNASLVSLITSQIAALVDTAPATLNTLKEIATALGNDPNFATTITNLIAGKANAVHTHSINDVTGLQTTLDGKQAAGDYATNSALTSGLSGKANTSHTQAATTITEDSTHRFVTDTEKATWNGKAAGTHSHTASQITDFEDAVLNLVEDVEYIYPSFLPVANAAHTITPEAPYIAATANAAPVPLTAPSLANGAGKWFKIRVIAASEANPVTLIGQFNDATNYVIEEPGEANFFADATTYRLMWVPDSIASGADGEDGDDGVGIPAGGTTGQILAKNSNADFDTEWINPPEGGGGGGGGMTDFHLVASSGSQGIAEGWNDLALTLELEGATSWNWTGTQGVVPSTGLYEACLVFRLVDAQNYSVNMGMALDVNGVKKLETWKQERSETVPGQGNRQSYLYFHPGIVLTAGQVVKMCVYPDGGGKGITESAFCLKRIR